IGHLSRGSIVEVYVDSAHESAVARTYTVVDLRQNGPNSFIFESDTPSPIAGLMHSFNLHHITRVISRVMGSGALNRKQNAGFLDLTFGPQMGVDSKHQVSMVRTA